MQLRGLVSPFELPGANIGEVLIVTHCLTVISLMLSTEMATARLFTVQCVSSEDLSKLEEIRQTTGVFKLLVGFIRRTADIDVFPELVTNLRDSLKSVLKAGFATSHTNVFPHDLTKLTMEFADRLLAFDAKKFAGLSFNLLFRLFEGRMLVSNGAWCDCRQVSRDGVRNDKVTVSQALHQG